MSRVIAGIDPGTKTGVALWSPKKQAFKSIETVGIVSAMRRIITAMSPDIEVAVYFEDARLRTWFGNSGREKLQGAGSIKRDSAIWQEFCEYYKIPYQAVKPEKGQTKWGAEYFKRLTGWEKRTSQHARDAAALVFGIK